MTDPERLALVRKALALDAGYAEHRLCFLRDLLAALDNARWIFGEDDPSAAAECLFECQSLLEGLTAAFTDELTALREAEQEALGEWPGPDDGELPY